MYNCTYMSMQIKFTYIETVYQYTLTIWVYRDEYVSCYEVKTNQHPTPHTLSGHNNTLAKFMFTKNKSLTKCFCFFGNIFAIKKIHFFKYFHEIRVRTEHYATSLSGFVTQREVICIANIFLLRIYLYCEYICIANIFVLRICLYCEYICITNIFVLRISQRKYNDV